MFAVSTVRPSSFAPFMVITAPQVDSSLRRLRLKLIASECLRQVQKLEEGQPGYTCNSRAMYCEKIGTFMA
jgi:hypothetical protein